MVDNGAQFFSAQPCSSAHGRIYVYSEWATDTRRGPNFSQLNVAQRNKSFATESGFHGEAAPHQAGQTHLHFSPSEILAEHFPHHPVEPAQMPRRLILLQAGNSSHDEPIRLAQRVWL